MSSLPTETFTSGAVVPVPVVLPAAKSKWSYEEAFKRNRGLITEEEQQKLRNSRVAIAGMGGVGGVHLTTLARLGIGKFTIADPDMFDVANFNRQQGAIISNLGRNKAEAMAQAALDINPELELRVFPKAIDEANVDEFLSAADLFIDGLDFFALDARRLVFRRAAELGIWAITAGPIGFSTAWLSFDPQGMKFDDYFDLHDSMDWIDQLAAFAVGLTPKATQVPYTDLSYANLSEQVGPSAIIGCQLAAGVMGSEVMKQLLDRGRIAAAPDYLQFDAYRNRFVRGRLRLGNRSPLQRIKRRIIKSRVAPQSTSSEPRSHVGTRSPTNAGSSGLPPIHRFLPLLIRQCVGRQILERRPETAAVTDQRENVLQYDQVMTTKLAIAYAVALELIYKTRPQPLGGSALDLACGPGHFSLCMAEYLKLDRLLGMDLSSLMVEVATSNARSRGQDHCQFQIGDITDLSQIADASYDLCTFTDAAHHMPDLATVGKVLAEMERVTRDNGTIFVMDLVRLKNIRITEEYIDLVARDYNRRGLGAFRSDFRNSMYAAWTCDELGSSIPPRSRRSWYACIPRGLPVVQMIVGVPRGEKFPVTRFGLPWSRERSPLMKSLRTEWMLMRSMLKWRQLTGK